MAVATAPILDMPSSDPWLEEAIATVPRPPQDDVEGHEFWRKEDPVIRAEQVSMGGMFEHQRKWWGSTSFIKALVGGYGSGKTNIMGKRAVGSALTNAPAPVLVVSPTYLVARETSILTIAEQLEGKRSIYGRRFWWKYNMSSHTFTIKFRGRTAHIIIRSGERPLGLRGPNLAAAYIDEPFIQDKDVFDQMIARVRHPQAKLREIGLTGTPEQLNWGYDLCVGDLKDKHDVQVFTASTRANLAVDPGYVQRLLGAYDGKAAQAFIEGEFVSLSEGMVYYAFDPMENVVALPIPKGAELGVGMDFNVNPMAAAVFWRAGNHVHFFDEIELPNADTEYMCSELHDRGYFKKGLRAVYPDASGAARKTSSPGGKSDFHYIKQAGFEIHARPSNPLRKDRYNAVNGKLKPREGKLTLTISPKLKKLRKYLSVYSHELLNKQDAYSHLLDAFSYPIAYLFPVTKSVMKVVPLGGI